MDIYSYNLYQWLTESCLICDSVNHIFLDHPSADAWECWNCQNRWWLDDMAKTAYIIVHGVEAEEAERRMRAGEVIFLNGQSQRY